MPLFEATEEVLDSAVLVLIVAAPKEFVMELLVNIELMLEVDGLLVVAAPIVIAIELLESVFVIGAPVFVIGATFVEDMPDSAVLVLDAAALNAVVMSLAVVLAVTSLVL